MSPASGDGFYVDPSSLSELAGTLNGVANSLNGLGSTRNAAKEALQLIDPSGIGGIDVLPMAIPNGDFSMDSFNAAGNALNSYIGDWSNAIAKIVADTNTISDALTTASQSYQQTEQDLTKPLATSQTPKPS